MKPFDLVVPGLCGPLPDSDGLKTSPAFSSLTKLLARADKSQSSQKGFHPELAALFGLTSLPSAALSLLGEHRELGEGYWFHADPVNLHADMDRAILRDSQSLGISQEEANALINEINVHFSEDGIHLFAIDANHWFINVKGQADIETTALYDVIGCDVNFHLPRGNDEKFWKRFLNEVQMLLHMSSVNQQRESSGQLPVNSLWLWGGGELPDVQSVFNRRIYANHPLVKGLAAIHDADYFPVTDIEPLLDLFNAKDSALIVLEDVFTLACYGDVVAWQEAVETLFEKWIQPLVKSAMSNKVAIMLYPCNGLNYLISPANRYRIFRKGNIKDHISVYE